MDEVGPGDLPDDRRVVRRERPDGRVGATVRGRRLAFAAFVSHGGGRGVRARLSRNRRGARKYLSANGRNVSTGRERRKTKTGRNASRGVKKNREEKTEKTEKLPRAMPPESSRRTDPHARNYFGLPATVSLPAAATTIIINYYYTRSRARSPDIF